MHLKESPDPPALALMYIPLADGAFVHCPLMYWIQKIVASPQSFTLLRYVGIRGTKVVQLLLEALVILTVAVSCKVKQGAPCERNILSNSLSDRTSSLSGSLDTVTPLV